MRGPVLPWSWPRSIAVILGGSGAIWGAVLAVGARALGWL